MRKTRQTHRIRCKWVHKRCGLMWMVAPEVGRTVGSWFFSYIAFSPGGHIECSHVCMWWCVHSGAMGTFRCRPAAERGHICAYISRHISGARTIIAALWCARCDVCSFICILTVFELIMSSFVSPFWFAFLLHVFAFAFHPYYYFDLVTLSHMLVCFYLLPVLVMRHFGFLLLSILRNVECSEQSQRNGTTFIELWTLQWKCKTN